MPQNIFLQGNENTGTFSTHTCSLEKQAIHEQSNTRKSLITRENASTLTEKTTKLMMELRYHFLLLKRRRLTFFENSRPSARNRRKAAWHADIPRASLVNQRSLRRNPCACTSIGLHVRFNPCSCSSQRRSFSTSRSRRPYARGTA